MPPKLWSQIAVESNTYHKQTIPARARAIRAQPRRRGDEVEDLGEIRRRLASVPDIQAFEVLRVMALLIARMLAPNSKGHRFSLVYKRFNKDKPHRWGTKVFVAVCAKTAYCLMFTAEPRPTFAHLFRSIIFRRGGGTAQSERLAATFGLFSLEARGHRSSVKLALELFHRRIYLTGTIQTDQSGYASGVITGEAQSYGSTTGHNKTCPKQAIFATNRSNVDGPESSALAVERRQLATNHSQ
ncbi:hypothetical protein ON010_g3161 [Phytophthora cinnamomi]|nr:hypothetical protein ON010_g3161 [Phytophthora cinnamomi]